MSKAQGKLDFSVHHFNKSTHNKHISSTGLHSIVNSHIRVLGKPRQTWTSSFGSFWVRRATLDV